MSQSDVPPFTTVVRALVDDVQGSTLWHDAGQTFLAWVAGMAIVSVVAVPLGLALGLSRVAYDMTHMTAEFVRTIPSIAALPLLILLYGVGFRLAVVMIVITAVWPLLIQSMYGARDVDPVARDIGRVYGMGRGRIFVEIVLPSAAPYIATGLRLAGVLALLVAVSESLIAGGDGLGAAIVRAQEGADVPLMYARIVVVALLGLLLTTGLSALERRGLRWHQAYRKVST